PAAYKGEPWARLGVDTDNDFKPLYVVNKGKKDVVANLRKKMKAASELYLATDEDREGEAIAWHLLEVLNPPSDMPVRRMVFHEITPEAIQRAIDEPREIDRRLVDAQEARRILDRLYGYEVSPVLWKKVQSGLSAGRVQSVATRIVVERERARMRFTVASYWDLDGRFAGGEPQADFSANLVAVDGARLATGKDFDEDGRLQGDVAVLDEVEARGLASALDRADVSVRSVESKPYTRKPYPPFMTSTLQQEAGRKLRFSSARTMSVAQRLYENGYITYMRTDSTTLSDTAVAAARAQILEKYGQDHLPDAPRQYTRKVKNAQEAHEAIRPAGDRFRLPEEVQRELQGDEYRLYELVWRRTVASQMTDARGQSVQVRLGATASDGRDAEFSATGKTIHHPGFLRAYVEGSDDPEGDLEDQERILPDMAEGDRVAVRSIEAKGHETQPPARFTEASLVRRLEELGVGRPSTYASIIGTIQDRGYVWKKGSALVPSFTAFAVITLLETHFPDLVDYAFTARMEDELDEIASGTAEQIPWLSRFYFGEGGKDGPGIGLQDMVSNNLGDIDARAVNTIPIGADGDGVEIVARPGRYGPYLQRGEDTASIPEDLPPDELTPAKAVELLEAPSDDRVVGQDPTTGLSVLARNGRFGPYVQLGDLESGEVEGKPKTASLFQTMTVNTLTLDEALQLLSLPRTVGVDPADGVEITVQNGRYGPYLKKDKDTRSLTDEDQLFTIDLEACLALLAQPKTRGRGAAKPPLKELGEDPATGEPMILKDGRFGPYVTDGTSNASLRKGDTIENITPERGAELLAERRLKAPPKKKAAAKKKPAAKKKTPAKKKPAAEKPAEAETSEPVEPAPAGASD
ncbi:MAG TPA: type I DNA topoisomerase, partial [Acidimicrobiales bacterium]